MQLFRNFLKNNKGATAIEYGLIAACIAIGLIASFQGLKNQLANKFTTIGTSVSTAS